MEVGDRVGILNDLSDEFVRDRDAASSFVDRGTPEPVANRNERPVEDAWFLKVGVQRRQSDVRFLDVQVLILLALIVSIPVSSVDEVQVV